MSSSTSIASTLKPHPLWATIPESTLKLAAGLGMEIIVANNSFGIIRDGSVALDGLTAADIEYNLMGYLAGREHFDVPALVDELAKAEQIIQTLTANMSDGQRTKATNSLEAVGFPMRHAMRCKERQALIAAARELMA